MKRAGLGEDEVTIETYKIVRTGGGVASVGPSDGQVSSLANRNRIRRRLEKKGELRGENVSRGSFR